MRNEWALAIAFWLIVAAAPILCQEQEPASSPDPASQTSAVPAGPEKTPPQATGAPETQANPPQEKPKAPAKPKTKKRRKHAAVVTSTNGRRTVVVPEGGASEPPEQIAPGMPPEEATRQRKNAEQWLGFTNDLLKQLETRNLDAPQQETVGHIKNFEKNASLALTQGELRRASTLAEKAYLLADDLVKHEPHRP